ncbi:uncharacterized protein [Palaemon carinicauda]|uniref:uncharacterized protein n=1 Tax=Palaemon carinicauda TaxID=392227 RepID=UPI0035B63CB9
MQKARPYSGDSLSSAELRTAENLIWRLTKIQEYEEELSTLSRKGRSLKRYGQASDHPTQHSLAVKLMVRATHESCGHCGQNHLMTQLRTNFWIVHGNAIVKTVIRECLVCRRLSRRLLVPVMAELLSDRLCPDEPPFTNTGLDCFGPFLVKQGRSTVKRWGAIFTCLTSRAVHLEVIHTMEQDSFVNAIRRFVARRGPIKRMWSDNGTNIMATERELREALQRFNEGEIRDKLSIRSIEWNFHPPHASHFGGVWKRLIRSVQRALTAACLQQVTTNETLRTLFCEVEAVVNSRPLTKINDDPNCPAPLTPNMILTLKGSPDSFTSTCKKDMYVKRRWRQAQFLADEFWRRWIQEYLPLLQERQKWSVPKRDINVGDVVLTLDERLPREGKSWRSLGALTVAYVKL